MADVVYEVVAEVTSRSLDDLHDACDLLDLGISGLILLDVVEAITEELGERTVGVDLDDDQLVGASTLGDLIALVEEGLSK